MRPEGFSTFYLNVGMQPSYAESVAAFAIMACAQFESLCGRHVSQTGTLPRRQVIMTTRKVFEEVLIVAPKVAARFGKSYATFFWDIQRKFHHIRNQTRIHQLTDRLAATKSSRLLAA